MANLDSLTLDIKADASKAVSSIDSLITKLGQLSSAMGGLANADKLSSLAEGVSALSGAMTQMSGVRKDTFVKLSESLATINSTETTNLENVANGVSAVAGSLGEMQGLNTSGVENIARSMKYLGSTTGNGGIANLKQLGSDLNTFANDLMFIPDTTEPVARISNVIEQIRRLGTKTGNLASANFSSVSTGLVKFINDMNGLNLNFDETKLTNLISSISRLGYASSTQAVANLPNLTRELKNLFDTLARTPAISNNLVKMTQALANLTANLGGVRQASSSATKGLNLFSGSSKSAKAHTLSLASAIGKLYATYFLLFRLISAVGKGIEKAMNVNEVQNYMENAMKQVARTMVKENGQAGTESAQAYLENYQQELINYQSKITDQMSGFQYDSSSNMLMRSDTKNLGMNPNDLITYQAQFSQMADSMGACTDNAKKLSQAYTKLGADLASVKDVDYADAWSDMSSGMVGMSKVMDKYGINIRVQALNQRLADMGIDTTVAKLDSEQKALLRTIVMLDSSRYAWTDLARTLDQPANQMRVLKNNVSALGMTIGSILLSGIARVLPYINALVVALQRLAQYIVKLFGITLPQTSSSGVGGFGDLADSIYDTEDAMDDASSSAKKLKNNLLGIDELNVISDNQGSNSSGAPAYSGDDLQKAFDELYDEYMKAWDEAYANMNDKIQELADNIVNAFKNGDYEGIGKYIADNIRKSLENINWDKVYSVFDNFGKNIASFLNGLIDPDTFAVIGKTIAGGINSAIHFALSFVDNFDWSNLGVSIGTGINNFLNSIDWKRLIKLGADFGMGIATAISSFLNTTDFVLVGNAIANLLNTAIEFVFNFGKNLDFEAVGTAIGDAINGLIEKFDFEKLAKALNVWAKGLVKAFASAIKRVDWKEVTDALIDSIGNLDIGTIAVMIGGFKFLTKGGSAFGAGAGASAVAGAGASASLFSGIKNTITSQFSKATVTSSAGELAIGIPALLNIGASVQFVDTFKRASTESFKQKFADFQNEIQGIDSSLFIMPQKENFDSIEEYKNALQSYYDFVKSIDYEQLYDIAPYDLDSRFESASTWFNLFTNNDETNKINYRAQMLANIRQEMINLGNTTSATTESIASDGRTVINISQEAIDSQVNAMNKINTSVSSQKVAFSQLPSEMQKCIKAYETSTGKATAWTSEATKMQQVIDSQKKSFNNLPSEMQKCIEKYEESTGKATAYREQVDKANASMNDSSTYFSTFSTNLESVTTGIGSIDETFGGITETTIPEFTKSLDTIWEDINTNLPDIEKSFADTIDNIKKSMEDTLTWYNENIAVMLTLEYWNDILSCIPTAFETTFTNACTVVINLVNRMIDAINSSVKEVSWSAIEVNGETIVEGGSAKLFQIPRIQGFEMGGYPDKGSLFMANEGSGAELIGNINGRTAVVNNDQIVQAVAGGVESAVANVMLPYLSQIAQNTKETANKDMSVNIGDREIARANIRGQRAMGRSIISTV